MDRTWGAQEIKSELWGGLRGAWLDSFEFEEFEEDFEIRLDTLRPFGWRRIQSRSVQSAGPGPKCSIDKSITERGDL